MTNTIQNPISCTSENHKNWFPYSLEVEAELEKLDREAGHDYVPMDIFIDPKTIKEHFQASSIRARWAGIHPALPPDILGNPFAVSAGRGNPHSR